MYTAAFVPMPPFRHPSSVRPMSIDPPPSLFVMTVVTPCMRYARLACRSGDDRSACVCVCGSMNPGATMSPVASIVRAAVTRLAAASPTNAIRSPVTPTSARRRGAPVPSTTRAAANQDVDTLLRAEQRGQQRAESRDSGV